MKTDWKFVPLSVLIVLVTVKIAYTKAQKDLLRPACPDFIAKLRCIVNPCFHLIVHGQRVQSPLNIRHKKTLLFLDKHTRRTHYMKQYFYK